MTFFTDDIVGEEILLKVAETKEAVPEKKFFAGYKFDICTLDGTAVGRCSFRVGHNELTYYGGNIGYEVQEQYRGHRYAMKACKLIFDLAKKHGFEYLIITCRPENIPSRRTCELLGGELLEIAALPEDNDMRVNLGYTEVCVFKYVI